MSRSVGLVLGWALDQAFGDPRRWHPVAGFGSAATALEQRTYAVRRARGVAHVALLVGATAGLGVVAERSTRRSDVAHTLVTAAATWAVLGGRSLTREASTIDGQLRRGDLEAARVQVRHLVGRDTTRLDADEVARACIESLAENTSDAVVAPLLWGGLLGVPGLLGYRAVNTLDAMVGHRNDRYHEFGWAAARLDDVVNCVPARVAAALALASAGSWGPAPSPSPSPSLSRPWQRSGGEVDLVADADRPGRQQPEDRPRPRVQRPPRGRGATGSSRAGACFRGSGHRRARRRPPPRRSAPSASAAGAPWRHECRRRSAARQVGRGACRQG